MPHPERYLDPTNHPSWTRQKELPEHGEGLKIFRNAVEYFA
jgi:phosphoribosylformylglycinamidine synthase